MDISNKLEENIIKMKEILPLEKSFDIIGRDLKIGNTNAYMILIDGFAKDDVLLWIIETLQALNEKETSIADLRNWIKSHIGYIEVETTSDLKNMQNFILSGMTGILIDGQNEAILIDARTYPVRGPSEPDLEKVTRGSRDGFVETIIFNTALIRRRVRDARLIYEIKSVGKRSKTDVAIAYIDDLVDKKLLDNIKKRIDNIQVESLIMAEKSLEELLIKKKWYNPLPQARFTERPDVAAAHLLEGHILLIVDTSPSVIMLPTTLFHFTQHSEDYYQNPLVGTYVRWIRLFAMTNSLLLTPIWLLFIFYKTSVPEALSFIIPNNMGNIPILLQLLLLEVGLDTLRIASIHTPNTLSTSLGIIGGLILSELAIKSGWVIPESVFLMAVVGIGTFASPSIEFSMAIRLFRYLLLITTGVFNIYGFIAGFLLIILIVYNTKTFSGIKYTWPLIPFNRKALSNVIFRHPIIEIKRENIKKEKL